MLSIRQRFLARHAQSIPGAVHGRRWKCDGTVSDVGSRVTGAGRIDLMRLRSLCRRTVDDRPPSPRATELGMPAPRAPLACASDRRHAVRICTWAAESVRNRPESGH
ncbi:unnamed protein product, partial [Iphiclides podalirius]